MQLRHMMPFVGILCLAGALAQDKPANAQAPAGPSPIIRTETKLVLVDTVVTDKKGTYIHDLALKDFRVWEDNKEVTVKSFSFEADPNSPTFTVPDIKKAIGEMSKKGVKLIGEMMEVPGHVKLQFFVDADGNTFQIVEELMK